MSIINLKNRNRRKTIHENTEFNFLLISHFQDWDIRRQINKIRKANGDLRITFGTINFINEKDKIKLWFYVKDFTDDKVEKWSIVKYDCKRYEDVKIIDIFTGIKTFKDFYDECSKHGLEFKLKPESYDASYLNKDGEIIDIVTQDI